MRGPGTPVRKGGSQQAGIAKGAAEGNRGARPVIIPGATAALRGVRTQPIDIGYASVKRSQQTLRSKLVAEATAVFLLRSAAYAGSIVQRHNGTHPHHA